MANASYQNIGGDGKPTSTFVPSTGLSNFLLTKGSSDSLNTFDNEYSYRINLENIGGLAGGGQGGYLGGQLHQAHMLQKKGKNLPQN
eukprot:CAMPEP_0202978390 /NCGR_PEP_ID=MMETSP1396-20130829/84824_1 /ASSEMBLY_ACC=CAM_ASM_000872 /TAXON_ID= /ORGANISM="Pseudokeronopsis sp., Strain Brazil" /LENGTH=86 /DNA_ID=CAMNT_0049717343 /DNA_START=1249 /DNA_END=1509 /DNA_ORIENTATION=-